MIRMKENVYLTFFFQSVHEYHVNRSVRIRSGLERAGATPTGMAGVSLRSHSYKSSNDLQHSVSGSLLAFANYITQLPGGGGLGLCTPRSR